MRTSKPTVKGSNPFGRTRGYGLQRWLGYYIGVLQFRVVPGATTSLSRVRATVSPLDSSSMPA